MTEYAADVIIPVHSAERPIRRAAGSVLDHTKAPIRVTVIAHNIDPEIIRERLGPHAHDPRLRLLSLNDGVRSPANPMNLGLTRATAPFIALLGSDDEFAPGAVDSWLEVQRTTGADAVLARIRLADGRVDPYPPVRRGLRSRSLEGVRDRLAYRSAPLGLVSRLRFPELRMTERVGSGEDLAYSLTVWFTGRNLAYDLAGPAYTIHSDAEDRVTSEQRPLAEDFAFLDAICETPWFADAPPSVRQAIVVKLIRIHLFDALRARCTTDTQLQACRPDFANILGRLAIIAPGANRLLSIADRRVLDALHSGVLEAGPLRALLDARQRFTSPAALLPRNPLLTFHRQAPFRTLLAGVRIMRAAA